MTVLIDMHNTSGQHLLLAAWSVQRCALQLCTRGANWYCCAAGVAAFIELCTEPLYIVASAQFKFGLRVLIETIAMVSKCLLTLLLVLSSNQPPALIFAWAQLVFAAITMLGYGLYGITLLQQVCAYCSAAPKICLQSLDVS